MSSFFKLKEFFGKKIICFSVLESIKYIFKTFKKCFYSHGTNIVLPNIENVFLDFIFQLGLLPLAAEIRIISTTQYLRYVSKYEHFNF